jgi:hypothetical protein
VSSVDDAWQQALAAEQAATFAYDVLGPRLRRPGSVTLARASQQEHRDLGEQTAEQLTAAGQVPVAPAVDYPLPFAVTDELTAARLALRLESACASAWRYLIAVADAPSPDANRLRALRVSAQAALTGSALRASRWRRLIDPTNASVPFPGIDK